MIKPSFSKVCENNVYHLDAYLMYQYISLMIFRYKTLTLFSKVTLALCSGFTKHMISNNYCVSLRSTCLFVFPLFKFICKYTPGTSNVSISLPLQVSINSVVMMDSKAVVGDSVYLSSFKYCFFYSHRHIFVN